MEAVPATTSAKEESQIISEVENIGDGAVKFNHLFNQLINKWQQKFDEITKKHQKVVVWGAGSKGLTYSPAVRRGDSPETRILGLRSARLRQQRVHLN
ncbi:MULTISPECIES: hypothetical protein [Okeania]|uniref:hypothetical protein n=1 Tax=Okeania TaxID=1458928 RepID=UPI000F52CB58|nr:MULTISPECIES: hypothetical protein [Okeania]NET13119.1 hypothetical protein [Okeania sp. SIO1H6]NES76346.1 hypothetical protein [Okeania sp. SIO1H4]NET19793.1 hypothetical protein [Okeania sp. SIO1H5]NET94104.1 hypothetical protein [Okeania sp. SIO1H2]RQH14522.1 hypothetical protein D4Z78_22395 [Okeania hirsuta]